MKRPIVRAGSSSFILRPTAFRLPPSAFTLVEVLVATVLTLIIMAGVVTVFAAITTSISQSRSTLEMTDRLRTTATELKRDLEGVTVTMLPPRRPESNEGYFEYIEGPVGPVYAPQATKNVLNTNVTWYGSAPSLSNTNQPYAFDIDRTGSSTSTTAIADTTVGDNDDILMFTTRAKDRPFVGKIVVSGNPTVVESWVAEVAWFVRGRTLYRRVLLVAPRAFTASSSVSPSGYYANYDVSAHVDPATGYAVPNSLGDLTKRENRFAHPYQTPTSTGLYAFPYDARVWGQLGLPTLRQTAAVNLPRPYAPYPLGTAVPLNASGKPGAPPFMARDFWTNPYPWPTVDPATGTQTQYFDPSVTRISDDVVLTNVLGFDVKAWDPGAPVFQYASTNNIKYTVMPGDPYYATMVSNITANPPAYYGAYVDLGWDPNSTSTTKSYQANRAPGAPMPYFDHLGQGYVVYPKSGTPSYKSNSYLARSGLTANNAVPSSTSPAAYQSARVYDTYSLHYEYDGINQTNTSLTYADLGTNGADDNDAVAGIPLEGADNPGEAETCPPYPVPLRGIQVKIRTMDPDSGQIREVTVVQDFLPQ